MKRIFTVKLTANEFDSILEALYFVYRNDSLKPANERGMSVTASEMEELYNRLKPQFLRQNETRIKIQTTRDRLRKKTAAEKRRIAAKKKRARKKP